MKDKENFNSIYWSLKLEAENDENDNIVRNYFKIVLNKLMEIGKVK